jgi:hypothetical protein
MMTNKERLLQRPILSVLLQRHINHDQSFLSFEYCTECRSYLSEHRIALDLELHSLTDSEIQEILSDEEVRVWLRCCRWDELFPDVKQQVRQEMIDKLDAEYDYQHVRAELATTKLESLTEEIELDEMRRQLDNLKKKTDMDS